MEEAVEPNVALASSYLVSTPAKRFGDGPDIRSLETRLSPSEELPSSPESFRLISNSDLYSETNDNNVQWQQPSGLASTVSNQSVAAPSLPNVSGTELSVASKTELSVEDMLMDLDEVISDVIMNPLQLADIGLYLPPVSADDVESLLSSPSVVAADTPSFPATASCIIPVPHAQFQAENPPVLDVETSAVESSNVQIYLDHVQAVSPVRSDTSELYSVSAACSPLYEEQVQVPSPASSQSSVSTVSSDRKQRKKQQNKTAAQKYRQKKRGEQGLVMTEYEQLEHRNIELRTRVEEMTREVDYLKGLIEEICA